MGKRGRPPAKEERVEPTQETAAKLRADYLAKLKPELQQAAAAIDRAFSLITGPMLCRASGIEPRSPGKTEISPAQEKILFAYRTWTGEMTRRKLSCEAVIECVVDCVLPQESDWRHRRPAGRSAELLIEGLEIYIALGPRLAKVA